ncbi:MAG: hypothetical protein ACI9FB_003444 [Candidatus Azotimanducaceae bacterium]|jgi:hypothetical protein
MSRVKAFSYHLAISLVIFFILAYLIIEIWYPDFFFKIDGGWEGIRLIIGVDLVLGPLLTLVIYKAGKPGLKFDLGCIAAVQSLCLMAGVYVIYSERPLYFIYFEDHFYSASAGTYENYRMDVPHSLDSSEAFPIKVISKLPDSPIEKADFLKIIFQDSIPAWAYGPTYRDLDDYMSVVVAGGVTEEEFNQRDVTGNLDPWLAKYSGEFKDYAFIPIHSRYLDAYIGINRSTMSFVDIIEVPPPF